jgi:hypothetical protein
MNDLPPAKNLTLRLTKPHALKVHVTDEKRRTPVQDAVVTLIDEEPQLDQSFVWGYHNLGGTVMRTDKDGWAVFPKLAFDESTVLVEHTGYGRVKLGWRQKEKEFQVSLSPEAVIQGMVTVGKQPLKDYWVRLQSAAGDQYSAEGGTATNQKFRVDQLPPGKYSLIITHENRQISHQDVNLELGQTREINIEGSPAAPGQIPPGK